MPIDPSRLRACEATLQELSGDVSVLDDERRLKALIAAVHRAGRKRAKTVAREAAPGRRSTQRRCYVCKERIAKPDRDNPALCPTCGEEARRERDLAADLTGRTALVTGGRVRVGFAVALRLLRAGASVLVTTRFPRDAARRYAAEPDFAEWADRLSVHALDLRDLAAAERFAADVVRRGPLDVLVNNAAQTVRRPPGYYRALAAAEADDAGLPPAIAAVLAGVDHHRPTPRPRLPAPPTGAAPERSGEALPAARSSAAPSSAIRALTPLLPGDGGEHERSFLPGDLDDVGGRADLRSENSWTARLDAVHPVEWLEALVVNLSAPAALLRGLRPALDASPHARRFVINVTSEEGRFARPSNSAVHPHTNAAKAGLNMLTRTLAAEWARDGIYLCGVDPGWVSDQRPTPVAAADKVPFVPPVPPADAAARVLDPVCRGLTDPDLPPHGVLLKDFRPVPW